MQPRPRPNATGPGDRHQPTLQCCPAPKKTGCRRLPPRPSPPKSVSPLAEVLTHRDRASSEPGAALVRAESDAVLCAQGMLGRFLACVGE
eukprot:8399613-Pyramimonas_sp.AAC.1